MSDIDGSIPPLQSEQPPSLQDGPRGSSSASLRRLSSASLHRIASQISRNGHESPEEEDNDGDTGASASLPPSPSPRPPSRPRSRMLTASPSRSPSHQRHHSPDTLASVPRERSAGPSRSSSYASLSASPSPFRSAQYHSNTVSPATSPIPRYVPSKVHSPFYAVPLAITEDDDEDAVEVSAPFESISLEASPPPDTVRPPDTPRMSRLDVSEPHSESKRSSWNGFGSTQGRQAATYGASSGCLSLADEQRRSSTTALSNGSAEAGPSTPPRMHAPPARPHPYPVPSAVSPPPTPKGPTAPRLRSQHNTTGVPGAKGRSILDKVVSHTRPSHLPPKDRTEDEVHYQQWAEMMALAREREREATRAGGIRRAEKEKRLAMRTGRWESLLGGDFSVAGVKDDLGLRNMWFEGIPSHLRGRAWALAIGNPLAMSKDAYKAYRARARRALDSGRFPQTVLAQMEKDFDKTFPSLKLFGRGSPMRAELREFLCTWVVYRSDEGLGYATYVNLLAAMLLLVSDPSQAFLSLVNLLSRPCLRAFYTETRDEIDGYYRVFENLEADMFPKIFANCKNLGLKVPEDWFRSLLTEQVPFEAACRLWDQASPRIVLHGDGYIFRASLAIVAFLEPRLHYPDKEEIASVFEGRNRATLAITERERERARMKGEIVQDSLDGKMSVFGLSEDALFEWLDKDGWKESRFERLVTREMPD